MSPHPGITVERVRQGTGWDVRFASVVGDTLAPTPAELAALRDLHERTAVAHAG
jgi:glutaconate CoA-transferase subunit B